MLALLLATVLTVDTAHPLARFDPRVAAGATIDAHGEGDTARIFTPANVKAMLSAGFQPLSYRLETELSGQAWHWNPRGRFSEGDRGYWTSDATPSRPIEVSYGYRLPRRGNTLDQAHDDDYSRIDDGDPKTFWKSNPYLGDAPQWMLVDLGAVSRVDAVQVLWAKPFATEYEIERWTGVDDPTKSPINGQWLRAATVHDAHGGEVRTELDAIQTRWLRITMRTPHPRFADPLPASGERVAEGRVRGPDWRDITGFAIAELSVYDGSRDLIRHAARHDAQSIIWVSSTDPWHRASDRDPDMEQPGFDLVLRSGLARGLPMLAPVSLLYGTPEDAANEIRYLRARGAKLTRIEMGEEPDGQNIAPEDYAALFLRWAGALHAVDPHLQLGGPAFQSTRDYTAFWPDARGKTSWVGRFLDALGNRKRELAFFSFEWYPVDDVCGDAQQQLVEAPGIYAKVVARWRAEGLPREVPLLVTEYGWSSYGAKEELGPIGAIFNADFLADFLASGGAAAYFYGLEPEVPIRESRNCVTEGTLTLFVSDRRHRILRKVPAYDAARKVMTEWLAPRGMHEILRVDGTDALLRAWGVRRPDGSVRVLIVNKAAEPREVTLAGRTLRLAAHSVTVVRAPSRRAGRRYRRRLAG